MARIVKQGAFGYILRRLKKAFRKILALVVVTVVFGYFYSWASPWAFPQTRTAGFAYGILHGALMPIALPSLLLGRDVPIYDTENSGRFYKVGYICGINLCGLAFFGSLFWRPRNPTGTSSGKSG